MATIDCLRWGTVWGIALLLLIFTGCGDRPSTASNTPMSGTTEAKTASSVRDTHVHLDDAMLQQVKLVTLRETVRPRVLTTTGKVQFNEDQLARILAPVGGQVRQLRIKVGEKVRQGEKLFLLHSRDIAAAADEHVESRKDLDLAEKTVVMQRDLYRHQATSRIAVQQAENEFAKAQTRVTRTVETLRTLGVDVAEKQSDEHLSASVPVRTPRAGTVIERSVTDGQFVQPDNTVLMTIADLSTLWVVADVFERDLHLVSVGQKAEVTAAAYPEHRFVAQVTHINEVVDPNTRTVKVRFLVVNPDGRLKPEMFASVTLFLSEEEKFLTIPPSAVFTEDGRAFVYLQIDPQTFVRQPVAVEAATAQVTVLSGLQVGEQIVGDGALLVRQEEARQALH